MRRSHAWRLAIRSAFVIPFTIGPLQAQSANELFQQALARERTAGRLREAIGLYERIVREHAGERAVAARALVQMGSAYERLGAADATAAYQRVVRDYGDQAAMVAEAKRRLATLSGAQGAPAAVASGPQQRRLWTGGDQWWIWATMTRDGQSVLYLDSGQVVIRNVHTGARRQISRFAGRTPGTDGGISPARFAVSPDGQQVAYQRSVKANLRELRVLNLSGEERLLVPAPPDGERGRRTPLDFTPDGRQLLVYSDAPKGGTGEIFLVTLADGSRTPLWKGEAPSGAKIAPDGQWIVYSDASSGEADILLRRLDGTGTPMRLAHPAREQSPFWTPDGGGIVFLSDRSGRSALWHQAVENGAPVGEATQIVAAADSPILGVSRNGSVFFTSGVDRSTIDIGTLDTARGTWREAPVPLRTLSPGMLLTPAWSSDGTQLAYVANYNRLRVRNVSTGVEREFPLSRDIAGLSWSPDGRYIVAPSQDTFEKGEILRVDTRNGVLEKLVDAPNATNGSFAVYSKDGRALFYAKGPIRPPGEVETMVVRRDLASGTEQTVYTTPKGFFAPRMALSPDGTRLAIGIMGANSSQFVVVSTDGSGAARELGYANIRGGMAWTPDGRALLSPANGGLVRTAVDGAPSVRQLDAKAPLAWDAALAPDGVRVALRTSDLSAELWTAEAVIPRRR